MLIPLLIAAVLAVPDPQLTATPDPEPASGKPCVIDHGKLNWFEGTYEEALVSAAKSKQLVFIDFWTEWCGYCKLMDKEVFCDSAVISEMQDVVCLNIDAESETGSVIREEYGVKSFPTLLFLNFNGTPRDAILGAVDAVEFQEEVARIKAGHDTIRDLRVRSNHKPDDLGVRFELLRKLSAFNETEFVANQKLAITRLINAGKGFSPLDLISRWELSKKLGSVGMADLEAQMIIAIRKLDPNGNSMPMRRIAFDEIAYSVKASGDISELNAFLEEETFSEILFEGWHIIYGCHTRDANRPRDRADGREARGRARLAAIELWKHTPTDLLAPVGNRIAWEHYEAADELTLDERAFALRVSKLAMKSSNSDPNVIDTYACCLYISGRAGEAIAEIERCIELQPDKKIWVKRRKEFGGTDN
ncbi:MAG: thiol-disulfide isomerase/thioredoxin [Planctomycetota bacterium]|jgi:thiol-disulfide isomerase/thioredoxin